MTSEHTSADADEAILIWNQGRYDYEVTDALEPVTFHLYVKVGSDREMVEAEYQVEGPIGWTGIVFQGESEPYSGFWPAFFYRPGQTYGLNITIVPPRGALNATHWFDLRGHLEDNLNATYSIRMGVIVRQHADFEWGYPMTPPPNGEFTSYPSNRVTVRLALFNTGNGHDTFSIGAQFEPPDPGWAFEFVNGANEEGVTPLLPPDPFKKAPHIIEVTVRIPALEKAGVTAQVTLNATSHFDPSIVRPPAVFSVTALQYYSFYVNVSGPSSNEGIPGGEVGFDLIISNLGNGWDTFTVKPIWDGERNPGFIASADPRNLDIEARSKMDVQYVVRVPVNASKGSYVFYAEVRSSSIELPPVTITFFVDVGNHYSIEIYSEEPNRCQTVPGGNHMFEVTVRNAGNGLDSIVIGEVAGAPPGWLVHVQPTEVTLLQGQEATVTVTVIVPSRFEEAPIGVYDLTLPASSSRGDAHAEYRVGIEITQFHKVEWVAYDVQSRRSINPFERTTISVTEQLWNLGNGRDTVTLGWYSPDPRISASIDVPVIEMDIDETRSLRVDIQVGTDMPPGMYTVFLNATTVGPEPVTRAMPVHLEIVNYDALVPPIPTYRDEREFIRFPLEVQEGEEWWCKLKIENAGTRSLDGVTMRAFDIYWVDGQEVRWNFFNFTTPPIAVGDRYIVGERPFFKNNPPLHWWANRTGNHTLEFRVYYPHQSNTDNDVARINITVLEAPKAENDDTWFPMPSLQWVVIGILLLFIASATAVGLHAWVKEVKKPLRPW